jgi:hypothetical protein
VRQVSKGFLGWEERDYQTEFERIGEKERGRKYV